MEPTSEAKKPIVGTLPELIDSVTLANYLNCDVRSARRYIDSGRLGPWVRLTEGAKGRKFVLRETMLEALREQGRVR